MSESIQLIADAARTLPTDSMRIWVEHLNFIVANDEHPYERRKAASTALLIIELVIDDAYLEIAAQADQLLDEYAAYPFVGAF